MSTNLGNIQTVSDLKQRELELKAYGFDIMREAESLQQRLNQLTLEKNNVIVELKKIYTVLETAKQQIQEQTQKHNSEHQDVSSNGKDNDIQSQEKTESIQKQSKSVENRVLHPAPVRRAKQKTRRHSTKE